MTLDSVRVGVFVCRCGKNIAGVLDISGLCEYFKKLPEVSHCEELLFACSADGTAAIEKAIVEKNVNRVVIAACTPRTHEKLFQDTIQRAGLNRYLLAFANVREHCSWVHSTLPEKATEKAKAIVRAALAKAVLLRPCEPEVLPVGRNCLVIGGGVAGMTAALTLADMGVKVDLLEKEDALGGLCRKLHMLQVGKDVVSAAEVIGILTRRVQGSPSVSVHLNSDVKDVTGYIGNFNISVGSNLGDDTIPASTLVVATGMKDVKPREYGYGQHQNVVTQLELEEDLSRHALPDFQTVVFINCVGSRQAGRPYCCVIGCLNSLKQAKLLKELHPDSSVYILYRDLMLRGAEEDLFAELVDKYGVIFVRYTPDHQPNIVFEGNRIRIDTVDAATRRKMSIRADLAVLATPLEANSENMKLQKILRTPFDEWGFFHEAHVKLKPVDSPIDGIYICGGAHWPKGVHETVHEAVGAAMRAAVPMLRGSVVAEGIAARIDATRCKACRICVKICRFGAPKVMEEPERWRKARSVSIMSALCRGCGTCAAECPLDAIEMPCFTDEQIEAEIKAALAENAGEKILAFCCNWCGYAAADSAGVSRLQYPPNVHIIRVMCSGRVDQSLILKGFELGAGMVLVVGCDRCHYVDGNLMAKKRLDSVRKKLAVMGVNPERLQESWTAATEARKFSELMTTLSEKLNGIGAK